MLSECGDHSGFGTAEATLPLALRPGTNPLKPVFITVRPAGARPCVCTGCPFELTVLVLIFPGVLILFFKVTLGLLW